MREILFIVATWTAAGGLLLSAVRSPSPVLWCWAAYTSLLALLALAHARGKRWGSVGSLALTFGVLVVLVRVLYLQIADREHALIPANWMAGFFWTGIGIDFLCAVLLVVTICWLALSKDEG